MSFLAELSMTVQFWDYLRIICIGMSGISFGLDLCIIYYSYHVLRPRRKIGFAFWHIVAISSIQYFIVASLIDVFDHFHELPTWRLFGFLPFIVIYNAGLVIILRVELLRYNIKHEALQRGDKSQLYE